MHEKIEKLYLKIKCLGKEIEGTKELLNEKLTFCTAELDIIDNTTEYYEGNLYYNDLKANKKEIERVLELPEHTRQANIQWKSCKKYLPSCISNIQILKRDTYYVNVYIRSSDVLKKLQSDVKFIYNLISVITKDNYKMNLTIHFGSAHYYLEDEIKCDEPKVIFFDGLDKTGKTSVNQMLFKMRDKIDYIGDRFLLSPIAYNKIFDRKHVLDKENEYIKTFKKYLDLGTFLIYFKCDPNIIHSRCVKHNESQLLDIKDVYNQKKIFDDCYENIKNLNNVFCVDTTKKDVFDTAYEIYRWLR